MNKILKIYFWQIFSISINLFSIFITIPFLSKEKSLYGIYSIILSFYLFITYTDIGFLSSGMKYASEAVSKNNKKSIEKIIGFTGFIFLLFVIILSLFFYFLSTNPKIILSSLSSTYELQVARKLLLILAITSPAYVFYRIFQVAFQIYLKDYFFQKIIIVFNLIKLFSTFYFFTDQKYDIVGYFAFSQSMTILAVITSAYFLTKLGLLDFTGFIKNLKFNRYQYNKTKKLAFASFFVTLSTILYVELDTTFIGKQFGPLVLANFAIANSLSTYYRTFFGILSTPFISKINHSIGYGNKQHTQQLIKNIIFIFLPFSILPVLIFILSGKYFILNWVGNNYLDAILITKLYILVYCFSFLNSPSSILILSLEKTSSLYKLSLAVILIYWIGIFLFYKELGIYSILFFKIIVTFLSFIFYLRSTTRFLEINCKIFLKEIFYTISIPLLLVIIFYLAFYNFYKIEYGKIFLIQNMLYNSVILLVGLIGYYFSSKIFKSIIDEIIIKLKVKIFVK